MTDVVGRLASVVASVRTPLTISGISILVLAYVLGKILDLGIFSNLDANSTYVILDSIIRLIFYTAILTIVLGAAGYVLQLIYSPVKMSQKPSPRLIEASFDPKESEYEEHAPNQVRPKKQKQSIEGRHE